MRDDNSGIQNMMSISKSQRFHVFNKQISLLPTIGLNNKQLPWSVSGQRVEAS